MGIGGSSVGNPSHVCLLREQVGKWNLELFHVDWRSMQYGVMRQVILKYLNLRKQWDLIVEQRSIEILFTIILDYKKRFCDAFQVMQFQVKVSTCWYTWQKELNDRNNVIPITWIKWKSK